MTKFIKGFIGYILFWTIVIVASIVFIKDPNILMSVLLLEVVILLVTLFYVQMVFIGIRQQYTTVQMNKAMKEVPIEPLSYADFDTDYKRLNFTLHIENDARIYHKVIDEIVSPSLKKPFIVSHVWIDSLVPIEQIVDYHQVYALDQHKDVKLKVGIFVTFFRHHEKDNAFTKTIIYDTSKKLQYYHIPVMITDNKTYLYDPEGYVINRQLTLILQHLNKTIKEKKLEF